MESFGDHSGIILGSFGGHSGFILGSFWGDRISPSEILISAILISAKDLEFLILGSNIFPKLKIVLYFERMGLIRSKYVACFT